MDAEEIRELLRLKGWTETELAAALKLSWHAVYKWFRQGGCPEGPAEILMRLWMAEARANGKPKKLAAAK